MIRIDGKQDGAWVPVAGARVQTLISNQDSGQRLGVQRWTLAAGTHTTPRCQQFEKEFVYVASGECCLRVGEKTFSARRGDLLTVPAGLPRQYDNPGPESSELVLMWSPGQVEAAFQVSSDEAASLALGVETLEAFASDYRPTGWSSTESATLRPSGSCPAYSMAGDHYAVLVAGADSCQGLALIDAFIPPGGGPIPHVHLRDVEAFLVLEGQLSLFADGKLAQAGPGDTVVLPTGIPHAFRNRTTQPVRMLILTAPAGFDRFVSLVGSPSDTPHPPEPSELKMLKELAPRFGLVLRPDLEQDFSAGAP